MGDEDLVRTAILDEAEGRTFGATPNGPFYPRRPDNPKAPGSGALTRPEAGLVQLVSYFRSGYALNGDPPTIDASVPEERIP